MQEEPKLPIFKKASMVNNGVGVKKRVWKSLKQILATERALQWPENAVTCKKIHNICPFPFVNSFVFIQNRFINQSTTILQTSQKIFRHIWFVSIIHRSTK